MKNARLEKMARHQRQYHRNHPWRLGFHGLFIPHAYTDMAPDDLSWWDDGGFILNKRRVIVWWTHPRMQYQDEIENLSWDVAGKSPHDEWLLEGGTKNYKKVGRSRKRLVSTTMREPSAAQRAYYDKLEAARQQLVEQGIDLNVRPTLKIERLWWATGVALTVPVEVRSKADLAQMLALCKQLMLRKTTLEAEFPGYIYARENWLAEAVQREATTRRKAAELQD